MPFWNKLKKKTEETANAGVEVGKEVGSKGVEIGKKGVKKTKKALK